MESVDGSTDVMFKFLIESYASNDWSIVVICFIRIAVIVMVSGGISSNSGRGGRSIVQSPFAIVR